VVVSSSFTVVSEVSFLVDVSSSFSVLSDVVDTLSSDYSVDVSSSKSSACGSLEPQSFPKKPGRH
jgi:hypothetical protein